MSTRPVWLTPHMGNRIHNLLVADGHTREADAFRLTWDAAPTDAAEALDEPLKQVLPTALMEPETRLSIAQHLLRALGCPETRSNS